MKTCGNITNGPHCILGDKPLQTENNQVREQATEYTVFLWAMSHTARGLAKAALRAQNLSYAIRVVEKQQISGFKNFQV
jgi:hypothetical protein